MVAYLVREPLKSYQEKLIAEVGPKYEEHYVNDKKTPVHITLKAPFETEEIEKLEKIINQIAKDSKKSKITVKDFGNFRRFVAFLKTDIGEEGLKIQKKVVETLKNEMNLQLHKHETEFHPHATISYGNTEETFEKIWKDLEGREKPNFEIDFDNITILTQPKDRWEVHKEYQIK